MYICKKNMKNQIKIALLILLTNFTCIAQSKFSYNQNGLTPEYLVIEIENKDSENLFSNSINWIKETYKNPDEVIKTTIEFEKIRFEGYQSSLFCINTLGLNTCYNATYIIEIEFKDGKYKFKPLTLKYRIPQTGAEENINFTDGKGYYKSNGKIRKMWDTIPPSIENLFNDLSLSLENYLKDINIAKDDW